MSIRPLWSTGAHYSPSSVACVSLQAHHYHLFRCHLHFPLPCQNLPPHTSTKNMPSLSAVPFCHPPSQLFSHRSILYLLFLLTIKKYFRNSKWHLSLVFRGIFLLPTPFPSLLLSNFEKCVVDCFFLLLNIFRLLWVISWYTFWQLN